MYNKEYLKIRKLSLDAFAKQIGPNVVGLPSLAQQCYKTAQMVANQNVRLEIAEERKIIKQGGDLSHALCKREELLSADKSGREIIDFDPASIYLIHVPNSSTNETVISDELEIDLLPERINRAGRNKQRTNKMAGYMWESDNKTAQKLATCNSVQIYRAWCESGHCRLINTFCCRQDKLCPVCANLRAGRNAAKALPKILMQLAQNPNYREYMGTFTVKNGKDLNERLTHLKANMKIMVDHIRKVRNGKGRHKFMEMCRVVGAIYSIEIVVGKNSGEWHPHVHWYMLTDSPMELDGTRCPQMEDWWLQRTGDSYICDIRPITSADRGSAVVEVLKYSAKFSSMTLEQNYDAWLVCTQGDKVHRLAGSIGCLRGLPQVQILTDPLSEDEGDFVDMAFRFNAVEKTYRRCDEIFEVGETVESRVLDQVDFSGDKKQQPGQLLPSPHKGDQLCIGQQ